MTPMNDKQKDLALQMAVVRARMSRDYRDYTAYNLLKKELDELLARFDLAASAPKRKPTTKDIEKPCERTPGWFSIVCREYGWTDSGWSIGFGHTYPKACADMIYAGLVATGNVPEVGE